MYSSSNGFSRNARKAWFDVEPEGLRGFDMQKCDNSSATVIAKKMDRFIVVNLRIKVK